MMDNHFKVRIQCMTYNHAPYIEDAMNGFCMQQTDFPFLAVVVDDASTDGEPEVIKHYLAEHFDNEALDLPTPDETDEYVRVFARHKENKNCYFLVMFLKYNHYSIKKAKLTSVADLLRPIPYIAMCEGEDYWIDPKKLQRQVEFLEGHDEYSLCCHRYKIYNQNNGTWDADYVKELFDEHPDGFSFSNKENLNTWITKTLSLVYRRDCYDSKDLKKYKYTCDEHSCYHMLKKGMGYCFPFFGGVYRRTDSGVFSPLSEKQKFVRWCQIRSEMLNNNLDDKELRDKMLYETRWCLYEHDVSQELLCVITACIRSYYHTDGLKGALACQKKLLKSYVNGFCRK